LLPIAQFPAPSPERLYAGVKAIRWSDHLKADGTLAVEFNSVRSFITHTQFGAQKAKDAICDQFRSVHGERPSVDLRTPDLRINIYVNNNEAIVSLDLSGDSLHRRGYRSEDSGAPLKETLAAAMLRMARWHERAPQGAAFVDPMCGSGTLPIEAAWIARKRAPGILRDYFGFLGWLHHDAALWKRLREEALAQELKQDVAPIFASDQDSAAISIAKENARSAGVLSSIRFERRDMSAAMPPEGAESGVFMVNPPYGERLGEEEELRGLYKKIGDTMKQRFQGWDGYVITSNPELAKCIGLKASRRFVVFNGALECRLLKFEMYSGTRRAPKGQV
jgi:23S rRNA (guanine2445-N2)-methyltransferase / 23S rRNA (guanine2069-N7)-methyltransferase